jgi:hypothetical protein
MILTTLDRVEPAAFADRTGWQAKPEGLCRGEICVPAPGSLRDDGSLDVSVAAARLGMPVVHDEAHGVCCSSPGRAIEAAAPACPGGRRCTPSSTRSASRSSPSPSTSSRRTPTAGSTPPRPRIRR